MIRFLSMHRVGLLATLLLVSAASALHAQTITTFDPVNSAYTVAQAINLRGQIAGYYQYQDANGVIHNPGFLRQPDGTFVSFEPEQSYYYETRVTDINWTGQIVGYFYTFDGGFPGFLRETDGTIVKFNGNATSTVSTAIPHEPVPCCPGPDGTVPSAINALGQITGAYGGLLVGFLRQPDGTTVNFSAAPEGVVPDTYPQAMNIFGQITGRDHANGFLRKSHGAIIIFDPVGSVFTQPTAINLEGQITGYYVTDASVGGTYHGFLRKRNGTIITFDPTGSIRTQAMAINLEGQITGYYATPDGTYHGFLRRRNGTIESFDAPGAANAGTFPKDINDRGQIVGYYQDANFGLHGFVRGAR